jgi:hypothetical protein
MTSGEAKLFSHLFFAEDDGETLTQVYREFFHEELDLSGLGGRVPVELSVALSRLATNGDAIGRLGNGHRQIMTRVGESKGRFEPRVEDWAEVYDEFTHILARPSQCLDSLDERKRCLLLKAALARRIAPMATFAGYDQAEFSSAIEMARARMVGLIRIFRRLIRWTIMQGSGQP